MANSDFQPGPTESGSNANDSRGQGGIGLDPGHLRRDCRTVIRAIKRGWNVPPEIRDEVIGRMRGIVNRKSVPVLTEFGTFDDEGKADAHAIAASRVIQAADEIDQRDDHHEDDAGRDEERLKNERLGVLSRLSDDELIAIARRTGTVSKLPPALLERANRPTPD